MHRIGVGVLAVCVLAGCQTVYYETMERFGVHKREILVDRIEEARDDQEEAKEQFQSALEQFTSVVEFDGGNLQRMYDKLNAEFERSEAKADDVASSIASVEDVAEALFKEWEAELAEYTSASLRRESERQLERTKTRYNQLIGAMKRAEARIEPVLDTFRDQVLFLKHNLNAQAIASLENELLTIEDDVARLIAEMESSINEANSFIEEMTQEET
jgi:hypothetical protein